MSTSTNPTSIWELSAGESAVIAGVYPDDVDSATQRLIDIGFREGQRVTCLLTPGFGAPHVFIVGAATYSLDRATAERIKTIEPES